jgi:hypothetical protein
LLIKRKIGDIKLTIESACKVILMLYICVLFAFYEIRIFIEAIFIVVMTLYFIVKRKGFTVYTLWSLLFIAISTLSNLWSIDNSGSLLGTRAALEIAIIGNLLVAYLDTKEKLKYFIHCFMIAGFVLVFKLMITVPISAWGSTRIGNAVYNANSIGIYLAFSAIFAMQLAILKHKKSYYILIGIFFAVILATGSRKSFFLILLGIAFLNILRSKKTSKKLIAVFVSLIIFVLGYELVMSVPILYSIMGSRLEGLISSITGVGYIDASTRIRIGMIEIGKELFMLKPILGHGINTFTNISGYEAYAHNNYIELLVGVGLIGTIIYYSVYVYIVLKLMRKRKKQMNSLFLVIIVLLAIIEYGLVSWQGELYQTLIAAAFAAVKLCNIEERLNNFSHNYKRADRGGDIYATIGTNR